MASVNKSDISEISEFMSAFWVLVKKYWIPEAEDEYWEAVMREASSLGRKYPDRFCKLQILAYLDYLEEKRKHEQTAAQGHGAETGRGKENRR